MLDDRRRPGSVAGFRPGRGVPDQALVVRLQEQVADALTRERQQRAASGRGELAAADQRQLSLALTRRAVQDHAAGLIQAGRIPPDADEDAALIAAVDAAIWGAGQLQALLDDPLVENIDINGHDQPFVTYADHRGTVRAPAVAASDDDLIAAVRTLGSHAGITARPFDPANPELDLRLPDGSRLSALMSASHRPLVSIRRNRFPVIHLDDNHRRHASSKAQTLTGLGTLSQQAAAFLRAAVLARTNIIVAGATNAGKTTLLRALIHCIPPEERLVTVERALELGIGRHPDLHPNVAELEEVLPAADGSGGIGIGALVRRTRRMNPSRVIVGEVMGPEVVDMLSAMSQGNDGSLSTIHARSGLDVFDRLAVYAAQHGGLPIDVTHHLVGGAVDVVVFIRKIGARRTVSEIVEVTGASDGRVTRSTLFLPDPTGQAVRDPEVPVMRAERLAAAGYDDTAWPAQLEPWRQITPGWTPDRNPTGYDRLTGNEWQP